MYLRYVFAVIIIVGLLTIVFRQLHIDTNGQKVTRLGLMKQRCSFELYKKVSSKSKDGNVDGRGYWSRDQNGALLQFYPHICRLSHGLWIPSEKLSRCFKSRNIRHITILGDSNGRYSMNGLYRLLFGQQGPNNTITCSALYTHMDLTYESQSSPSVLIKRQCGCGGVCTFKSSAHNRIIRHAKCEDGEAMSVLIEYVSLMYWQKTDFRTVMGCSRNATDTSVVSVNNTVDYTLSDYMTNPRPDVIILMPNVHDKYPLNDTSFVEHQLDLLDRFVSNTTQVVLLSVHNIVRAKMALPYRDHLTLDENGTLIPRDEWARKYNNLLYRMASKRFISGRKPLLMPNMVEVSNTITDLYPDGHHLTREWYQSIMSAVVQNLCDI